MRGWVIGTQCQASHKQAADQHLLGGSQGRHKQGHQEQHHFTDKHRLTAQPIGQTTQKQGAKQNAGQGGRGDQPLVDIGE